MRLRLLPLAALLFFTGAHAHRLPMRAYTIADGLARDTVRCVVPDSLGFLWFCTEEGLSRFDGTSFRNFGSADGLGNAHVRDFLESEPGVYWVGTHDGVYRFDPKPSSAGARFTRVPGADPVREPHFVSRLFRASSGRIWVAAAEGAFVLEEGAWRLVPLEGAIEAPPVRDFADDGEGGVWIAARYVGLLRAGPDAARAALAIPETELPGDIRALARTTDGDLWLGTLTGIFRVRAGRIDLRLSRTDGLPEDSITSLALDHEGRLLVGVSTGLVLVSDLRSPRPRLRFWGSADGLRPSWIVDAEQDVAGDLWLASLGGGVYRIAREGFTTFDAADGVSRGRPTALFLDGDGRPCVPARLPAARVVASCFDGSAFVARDLAIPAAVDNVGWGAPQVARDARGRLWVATGRGVLRFDRLDAAPRRFTPDDGLPGEDVLAVWADRSGGVWASAVPVPSASSFLAHLPSGADRWEIVPVAAGIPRTAVVDLAEDGAGNLWFAFENGIVARRREGAFRVVLDESATDRGVTALFADAKGRLWMLGSRVHRVDDPAAAEPVPVRIEPVGGFSSEEVRCAAEDRFGRLWFGTGRGVDRLDPKTGRIRRFLSSDGLANNEIVRCLGDREGNLWFAVDGAVSRIVPAAVPPSPPPRVRIGEIRVAGTAVPISEVGEAGVEGIELQPGRNNLALRLIGLGASPGERMRFQQRIGDGAWGPPQESPEVVLAGLAPGRYRLEARALGVDGTPSATPAVVEFRVIPPVWRRPWFLALAGAAVAGTAYAAYRARLARLLAVEGIRRRIAMDLHDEVGSGLSQIALWSEVLRDDAERGRPQDLRWIERISATSGALVDALGDVVWSIDPRRDRLGDLLKRMRRFLEEGALARGATFSFSAPEDRDELELPPEPRRHLWLAFKEGVNNALKHSGATRVEVRLVLEGRAVALAVADDGSGFDPSAEHPGTGLSSLRRRAAETGGRLEIASAPGRGTVVTLKVPLR